MATRKEPLLKEEKHNNKKLKNKGRETKRLNILSKVIWNVLLFIMTKLTLFSLQLSCNCQQSPTKKMWTEGQTSHNLSISGLCTSSDLEEGITYEQMQVRFL